MHYFILAPFPKLSYNIKQINYEVFHYMNKKEISEIKKQFTPENCSITRICGCYVDGEKNKKTELKEAFLSLS